MSKTWNTKKKIIRLISKDAKTPSEISTELNLAPSTVSEHIEELERMGAIRQIDNPYIKKWKYYKANPDFETAGVAGLKRTSSIPQIAGVLIILLGLVALLTLGTPAAGAGNQVVFSLTDPPKVPSGTQSLNITYSSIQAHYVESGGASGWVSGTGSGSLDLMSLINTSEVIGTGKIPANATIDAVSFDITSAKIVINGTSYNVTVPSGNLTAKVTGTTGSGTNSSVLIDISPVVATIYTNSSVVFVMVPSVKAVVLGNVALGIHMGDRHQLSSGEQQELNSTSPQVSISSANLQVVGNSTVQLSVTVKNNGNDNITLRHVILYGLPTVYVTPGIIPMGGGSVNATAESNFGVNINERPMFLQLNNTANITGGASVGGNWTQGNAGAEVQGNAGFGTSDHGSTGPGAGNFGGGGLGEAALQVINGIHVMETNNGRLGLGVAVHAFNTTEISKLNTLVKVGEEMRTLQAFNFLVATNGTLILPPLYPCPPEGAGYACPMIGAETQTNASATAAVPVCLGCPAVLRDYGYVLQPGASATFTFSGQVLYGNGHIRITPVQGTTWKLVIAGDGDAEAATNVTVVNG